MSALPKASPNFRRPGNLISKTCSTRRITPGNSASPTVSKLIVVLQQPIADQDHRRVPELSSAPREENRSEHGVGEREKPRILYPLTKGEYFGRAFDVSGLQLSMINSRPKNTTSGSRTAPPAELIRRNRIPTAPGMHRQRRVRSDTHWPAPQMARPTPLEAVRGFSEVGALPGGERSHEEPGGLDTGIPEPTYPLHAGRPWSPVAADFVFTGRKSISASRSPVRPSA